MNCRDVEDLQVGMQATFSKTFTEEDFVLFAGVSGDSNAVHARVSVSAIDPAHRRVTFDSVCRVGTTVVIDGQALAKTTSSAQPRPALANEVAMAVVPAHSLMSTGSPTRQSRPLAAGTGV